MAHTTKPLDGFTVIYGPGQFGQGQTATDGAPSAQAIGGSVDPAGTTWTVEIVVEQPANVSGPHVALGGSSGPVSVWLGTLGGQACFAVGGTTLTGGPSLNDGQPKRLRVTCDGTTVYLFVDGVLVASMPANSILQGGKLSWGPVDSLVIGKLGTGGFAWIGYEDMLSFWSICLSTATYTLATSPWTGSEPGLDALFQLNGDGVDTAGQAPTTPALAAGTVTVGALTTTTASLSATEATGGAGTYSHQWYRSTAAGSLGAALTGATGLTLADTGLTAATAYFYTLKYTETSGNGATVAAAQVTATTAAASGGSTNQTIAIASAPINWYGQWASGKSFKTGAYFELAYTGDVCILQLACAGYYGPDLIYRVDDGPEMRISVASGTSSVSIVAIYAGTGPGAHATCKRLRVTVAGIDFANTDNWPLMKGALQVTGVTIAAGAVLKAIRYNRFQIAFIGDSITESINRTLTAAGVAAGNLPRSYMDGRNHWPMRVAENLGAAAIVLGAGGSGITVGGQGGVPKAIDQFGFSSAGVPWVAPYEPAGAVIYHATNDRDFTGDYAAEYRLLLVKIRTAWPKAVLLAVCPVGCDGRAPQIAAAVAAMNDPRIFFEDCSGVNAPYQIGPDTSDQIGHPNPGGSNLLDLRITNVLGGHFDTLGIKFGGSDGTSTPTTGLTKADITDAVWGAGATSRTLTAGGLDAISTTPPARNVAPTWPQQLNHVWGRSYRRHVYDPVAKTLAGFAGDGTTILTLQDLDLSGSGQTQGALR